MDGDNPEPQLPKDLITDDKELALLIEQAYKFKKTIVRAHDEVNEKFQEMIASQERAEERLRAHVLCGGVLPAGSHVSIARIEGRTDYRVDMKLLLGTCDLIEETSPNIAAMIRRCITSGEREATTQLRYHD